MGAAQHRIEVHRALVVLALEVPVRFETVPAAAGEADAYFAAPDGMVISQAALVVDAMTARKLPAMFAELMGACPGSTRGQRRPAHSPGRPPWGLAR